MAIIVGWAAGATGRDVALIDADAPAASRPISDPGRGTAAESSAGESPQLPVRVQLVPLAELPRVVAERESAGPKPRWVWHDTAQWYPALLDAGVRVERCHDLRLCHAILHGSVLAAGRALHGDGAGGSAWDAPPVPELLTPPPPPHAASALFDIDDFGASRAAGGAHAPGAPADDALPASAAEALAEWQRQAAAVSDGTAPERLRLLLAAESAGALMASEMHAAGLPWRADVHDRILVASLGPKPAPGALPERMALLARAVRDALGEPELHLDSQPRLLRALHRAGIFVESTSRWELRRHSHPAIEPLLEYKTLARLLSANGWAWLEEWVLEGRFRPTFVPGGVVTGRWASSGGGALQLPKQLRAAVRPDPGWALITADVAQLEPRVLAAMAGDASMAAAGRGADLYAGIVATGAVDTREHAKLAVLGAMYGATTGESGRLVPRLRRAFPQAMRLVDHAARAGERGETVTTWLGRSSPPPGERWRAAQAAATQPGAGQAEERRARQSARDRGRFTRNFVVQGTAAEWALCWMADLRLRLASLGEVPEASAAPRSGPAFARRAHLAFFLHDEIIVHAPHEQVDAAASAVREAAASAGRLMFGGSSVDFPLELHLQHGASEI
ncbi:MAG: bifunctional 3'-5' exonuclease/DNA polymerase [Microbacteriaceae bacterium]|nr:bifunctional 3'-5' exonuclease/DNA polymerase [Microbacteriaceae bacterium]